MFKGLLSFIFATLLGFYYSGKLRKKQKIIEGLIRFNNAFLINVKYKKLTLPDFISAYKDEDVEKLLKQYLISLKAREKLCLKNLVPKEIESECENYFNTIGKSDSQTQTDFLKSYCEIFTGKLEEFKLTYGKKTSLYPKLGILSGAVSFILLV